MSSARRWACRCATRQADAAAYAGLTTIGGVLVEDYGSQDSPARQAGVRPGDVIIAVDGHPVSYVAQLQEAIAFRKPGDVVSLEVVRKGGEHATLHVKLQSVDGEQVATANRVSDNNGDESGKHASAPLLGVAVAPTDASVVQELQLPDNVRGEVVMNVEDGSPASGRLFAAEQNGPDIIISVEGTPVPTPECAARRAPQGVGEQGQRWRRADRLAAGVQRPLEDAAHRTRAARDGRALSAGRKEKGERRKER